ncbi:MAG: TonB-dependent receptor [Ignavibacteriae bacterium]|nr:TonB-dependent receptor [Ignavibacteriota bacterium]
MQTLYSTQFFFRYISLSILLSICFSISSSATSPDSTISKPRLPAVPHSKKTDSVIVKKNYTTQQVVVTGTRNESLVQDSPVRVEVISNAQLQSTAMVNAADLLREQTGLLLTTNLRTGIQMMGLGPDYTMILIDGQPMVGRIAGVLELSRISVGNIDRVEIVKGPMSSLYGSDALAGVINIITKKPKDGLSGKVYSQYLQHGAAEIQLEGGYGGNDIEATAFFNRKSAEPFELQKDSLTVPYSGFTDYTSQIKALWRISPSINVSGNGRFFQSDSRGRFTESFFGQIASNKGSVHQKELSGTIASEWTHGKARLTGQLYGSKYTERYDFDTTQGSAGNTDDFDRQTFKGYLQYDVFWNLRNRFTFGLEENFDDTYGSRYPDKPSYRTFSVFGQWEGNPTEWVSYSLSARYVNNSAYANPSFSGKGFDSTLLTILWLSNPKLALNFKLTDNLQFRTSIGTGYKVPDFRQLYIQFSNNLAGAGYNLLGARRLGLDLQPERSTAFDAGFTYSFTSESPEAPFTGLIEIRAFRNNLSNLIEFYLAGHDAIRNVDIYSYHNLAHVYTQGIEANIRVAKQITIAQLVSADIGYQYLDAKDVEVLNAIDKKEAVYISGEYLLRKNYGGLWLRSKHSGVARVQFDEQELGIRANIRLQYVGRFGDESLDKNGLALGNPPRRVLDRDDEYVPGYTMLNAAISKRFENVSFLSASRIETTIGVNNILNEMNLKSIPSLLGRQFFVNLAIQW